MGLSGFVGNKDNSEHVNARGKKEKELLKLNKRIRSLMKKGKGYEQSQSNIKLT